MANFKLLFPNTLNIDRSELDEYGTLKICLSADMPR